MKVQPDKNIQTQPPKGPKSGIIGTIEGFFYYLFLKFMSLVSSTWSLFLSFKNLFKFKATTDNKKIPKMSEEQFKESAIKIDAPTVQHWKYVKNEKKYKKEKINSLFRFCIFDNLAKSKTNLVKLLTSAALLTNNEKNTTIKAISDEELDILSDWIFEKGEFSNIEKIQTCLLLNCFKKQTKTNLKRSIDDSFNLLSKEYREESVEAAQTYLNSEIDNFRSCLKKLNGFCSERFKEETEENKKEYLKESFEVALEAVLDSDTKWAYLTTEEKNSLLEDVKMNLEKLAEAFS